MKKNNALVFSLVAIVILLVAVIGVTYAYFTSQVKVTNNDQNTTEVKTAALASATMDMGSKVVANDMYPGATVVKSVNVKGSCGNNATTCDPVAAVISVTPNIDSSVFGTDVEWALYKSEDAITCKNVVKSSTGATTTDDATKTTTTENQYKMESTCKFGTATTDEDFNALTNAVDFSTMTPVLSSGSASTDYDVSVAGNTDDNYYLVVTYKDNGNQDAQQGKDFSVAIGFAAKPLNS